MRVLILSGNPRKNGNTMKLTNNFIKGVKDAGGDVDFIDATILNINPCIGCLYCMKNGRCHYKDDMDFVYEKIINCDLIVLSSPVYFASVSAQLKALIDRCQMLFSKSDITKIPNENRKPGYLIFTAGGNYDNMVLSMELLAKFFFISCGGKLKESIYALGTDELPVDERDELLKKAYEFGKFCLVNR